MEEYRSNSIKSRETVTASAPEKKVNPVISGGATTQKKSGIGKFTSAIITEDLHSVGSWIFSEVMIPSFKKVISDIVTNGIDMLLYGKASGPSRGSTASRVSYGNYYQRSSSEPLRSGSSNNSFDYDNIIFSTRGDAEAVLTGMEDLLDQFETISVAEYYELADVACPSYTANKYGWTSLKGAQILRCRDGYLIKLPKVIVL